MPENIHNLHVPLPDSVFQDLKRVATQMRRPLTDIAREALATWMAERQREALLREIQEYAQAIAGSHEDLDAELEASAIDDWMRNEP